MPAPVPINFRYGNVGDLAQLAIMTGRAEAQYDRRLRAAQTPVLPRYPYPAAPVSRPVVEEQEPKKTGAYIVRNPFAAAIADARNKAALAASGGATYPLRTPSGYTVQVPGQEPVPTEPPGGTGWIGNDTRRASIDPTGNLIAQQRVNGQTQNLTQEELGGGVAGNFQGGPKSPLTTAKEAFWDSVKATGGFAPEVDAQMAPLLRDPKVDLAGLQKIINTLDRVQPNAAKTAARGGVTPSQKFSYMIRGVDNQLRTTRSSADAISAKLIAAGYDPEGDDDQFTKPGEDGWLWDGADTVDSASLQLLRRYKQLREQERMLTDTREELLTSETEAASPTAPADVDPLGIL